MLSFLDNIISDFSLLRKCVYAVANNIVEFIWGEKMLIKDAVVKRFQNICKSRNIRYNELATLSGVTPSTVYSLMDDRRRDVSLITVKKLCDGLEMPINEFFDDDIFKTLDQEIS